MTTEIEVDAFVEHFGVKGMKWGKRRTKDVSTSERGSKREARPTKEAKPNRKQRKAAQKAFQEAQVKAFKDRVMKDIGSRSPSELYAVRGTRGPTTIMTGKEFMERTNMGVPFVSIQSTGYRIDDGN